MVQPPHLIRKYYSNYVVRVQLPNKRVLGSLQILFQASTRLAPNYKVDFCHTNQPLNVISNTCPACRIVDTMAYAFST